VSLWTLIRCDYFDGHKICPAFFRTQLARVPGMREAQGYGWTRTKRYGIRCKMHQNIESQPFGYRERNEEGDPQQLA